MKIISNIQLQFIGEELLNDELQRKQFDFKNLNQLLDCLRWDPRICEMAVSFFFRRWVLINPLSLNHVNQAQETPSALGVILEHVLKFSIHSEKKKFKAWMDLVLINCAKAQNEQFYIGVYPFASSLIRKNAEMPLKIFSNWGFFERNLFLNKAEILQKKVTQITPLDRDQILQKLYSAGKPFTIQDYHDEVGAPLSRRQAERDLKASTLFKKIGHTKNRKYVPKV